MAVLRKKILADEAVPLAVGAAPEPAWRRPESVVDRVSGLLRLTYELPDSSGRLRPMEGLRGSAVLLVFFVHFHALFGEYARQIPVVSSTSRFLGIIGNSGVDLFFVLSGYLIYGTLIRKRADLLHFIWRRIERIYPTFLVVFALYLVLSFFFREYSRIHGSTWSAAAVYILQNLLLLPGMLNIRPIITVAWSLSYEFFFYIGAALLIAGVRMWNWRPKNRVFFFVAVWCGYLTVCFTTSAGHVRTLMFTVGILLYEALSAAGFRRFLTKRGEILAIALVLASSAYIYLVDARPEIFSALPGWKSGRSLQPGVPVYEGPYKTSVLSVSLFWCTAYCIAFGGRLSRLFSWAPLRYLGNISYSYYLIHGVTLQAVALVWQAQATHGAHGLAWFLLALPVGFAATWISSTMLFLAVEKPSSFNAKRLRKEVRQKNSWVDSGSGNLPSE